MEKYLDSKCRHDFLFLIDITNGNPNGDPDAEGKPRVDPTTGHGIITDVCIKRKTRNYLDAVYGNQNGCAIYIQNDLPLQEKRKTVYDETGLKVSAPTQKIKSKKKKQGENEEISEGMEERVGTKETLETMKKANNALNAYYLDCRLYGGAYTMKYNCGKSIGPFQLSFSRSIDPIEIMDVEITRKAINTKEELEGEGKLTEMGGTKSIVPYALYKGCGFFTPHFAFETGVSNSDVEKYWEAMKGMFVLDKTATRNQMILRGLYIFTHDNPLGNAYDYELFQRIQVTAKIDTPRKFEDYKVIVDDSNLPEGITLTKLIG